MRRIVKDFCEFFIICLLMLNCFVCYPGITRLEKTHNLAYIFDNTTYNISVWFVKYSRIRFDEKCTICFICRQEMLKNLFLLIANTNIN